MQGVPGYEIITGTAPASASVRRLSFIIHVLSSVFLAVVESGRGKGGELHATVQGLGNFVVSCLPSCFRDKIRFLSVSYRTFQLVWVAISFISVVGTCSIFFQACSFLQF